MATFDSNTIDKVQTIQVKGDITGDQDFPKKAEGITNIELYMGEVGYINSSGIRSWIDWKKNELEDTIISLKIH